MLNLHRFVFNPFYENTFLIWDSNSNEGAVIDPGMYDANEESEFTKYIDEHAIKIKYIINTHCHVDHVLGNKFVKEKYSSEFWAPEKDLFLLEMLVEQSKMFGINSEESPKPDFFIEEDSILKIGNTIFNFIFTPGHTPGEYCVHIPSEKILFAGDVLFRDGIGRTDLWGGDYNTLIASITKKLFMLPDETKVYPGHDMATTIDYEKKNNPYLSV